MSPAQVKICGVTRAADARLAVELGADFVGINFWPGSPRCVTVKQAAEIAETVRGRATLVGVWVEPEREEVEQMATRLGLDLLQFHGDESPALVNRFASRAIKAFRMGSSFDPARLRLFSSVWGYLFDAAAPGRYGGTGMAWGYESIAELAVAKRTLLAGGLRPDNVAEAIARSRADIVDVCSGVESRPGVKDAELMRRFLEEVRNAQKRG